LDLSLHTPARNESGVELAQDISQRQRHQNAVAIILGSKNLRGGLAQFAEGHLDGSARQLGKHFLERYRNGGIPNICPPDARLQLKRETLNDGLERYLNSFAIAIKRRAVSAQRWRLEDARFGNRLRCGLRLSWGVCVVLRRCLRRLAQQVF
jgi:hypothetical protein